MPVSKKNMMYFFVLSFSMNTGSLDMRLMIYLINFNFNYKFEEILMNLTLSTTESTIYSFPKYSSKY